ncbi:AlbA family DNA-binding domain-containing protein [Bergeyella zoohelcum]|uniref:Schlafen AlbA-2 domain-containing protein n=1 Tax=Bergeyella zoohelcum ATCC 43767 TaxID=883096 RepID=K1LLG9_9FLAO|nr:RNA-binding domain-containing protein [Bergeyella zoohelcum]EKB55476.1 hypothetical protein HMPREF9699_01790 [Bergeyella zoohelcum ATCC 43767]SUV50131.1 Divergent AAA domain [Bergeyella zoohelcum]
MKNFEIPNHRSHRKYTLLSIEENHCIVQNIEDGHTNHCFLIPHKVGDVFWLFEKSINAYNGNITFEYSILNLYEKDAYYDFNIIKETEQFLIVSNFPHLTFAAPLSFREDKASTQIRLFVKNIDLDKNKLFFSKDENDTPPSTPYYETDLSVFEQNKIYHLPFIKNHINRNGTRFLVVEYKGKHYHISVPEKHKNTLFEKEIGCQLSYHPEGDRYYLKLTRYALISAQYKKGNQYPFTLQSITLDAETATQCWILKDENGYINHYYPDSDLSRNDDFPTVKEGDVLMLYVWKINEKGYLSLSQNASVIRSAKYEIEDVFSQIGYQGAEQELFYDLGKEQLEKQIPTEEKPSFLEQYHDGENLWFFTYFNFLDEKIDETIEENNYPFTEKILDTYIRLERWLIYTSDYLKNFLPYKAAIIIEKAETKIESLEAHKEAIHLIINEKETIFFEQILSQLKNTRYLPKQRKDTFKALIKIIDFIHHDETRSLCYTIFSLLYKNNLLVEQEKFYISRLIEKKLQGSKSFISEFHSLHENQKSQIKKVIPFQYLLCVFTAHAENTMYHLFSSVTLARFLSQYYQDIRYLKLAISIITKNGNFTPNFFLYDDVFDMSFEQMNDMVTYPDFQEGHYEGKGKIIQSSQNLIIIPQNHFNKKIPHLTHPIAEIEEFNISVHSSYFDRKIDFSTEKKLLLTEIHHFLNFFKNKSNKNIEKFKIGHEYIGKVKSVQHNLFCFLQSKFENEYIEPLLHTNCFNRSNFFGNIKRYLSPSDSIRYLVENIAYDKTQISCLNFLKNHAENHLLPPKLTKGIVIFENQKDTYVITEEGWPVLIQNQSFPIDAVLKVEITEYDQDATAFIPSMAAPIEETWDNLPPTELYRKYLEEAGVLLPTSNEAIDNPENTIHLNEDFRKSVVLLLNCLDQYKNFILDDREKITCLFVQIILSGIIKSGRSYHYYTELEEIKNNGQTVENSEQLCNISKDALHIMHLFDQPKKEIPETNWKLASLKQLVQAYHTTLKYGEDETAKNLFIKLIFKELEFIGLAKNQKFLEEIKKIKDFSDPIIHQPEEERKIIGVETKNQEFKSSLFYSASHESQEKVIMKSICGFLNSSNPSSSLFIGVKDTGEVVGLENDLKFTPKIKSLDQYQNHIQSLIVGAFPKEINHLIDFIFHKAGNLDYLEIKIPKYDKPVSYDNEFYQRQGIQTRILKGTDLTDFMYRKAHGLDINNDAPPSEK